MKAMRILAAAATLSVGNALTQHVEERKLMSYVSYTYNGNKIIYPISPKKLNRAQGYGGLYYTLLFVVYGPFIVCVLLYMWCDIYVVDGLAEDGD